MSARSSLRHACLMSLGALIALGACYSEPARMPASQPRMQGTEISNEATATATVVALDPAERLVTLRREDGSLFEVEADASVRNYDQIEVGEVLRVRYRETLAASLRPSTEGVRSAEGAFAAARAPEGAKPGGGMGLELSLRVKIESIDRGNHIVVFSLASGELIARRVQTAEGRAFLQSLKQGDLVQLDYSESIAIAIEKN